MKSNRLVALTLICFFSISVVEAEQNTYKPARVVYDVSSANAKELENILDRASLLQRVYGNDPFESSIVLVIHEHAIPFFTRIYENRHKEIYQRAKSLVVAEVIQFRICRTSAKMQGFAAKDFDSYIKLVPMADAEIVKLQNEGYSYLK